MPANTFDIFLDDCQSVFDHDQLAQRISTRDGSAVIFDMTGIDVLPDGLLQLLGRAQAHGLEVEIMNPSSAVQEYLRVEKLNSLLLIRGTTACSSTDSGSSLENGTECKPIKHVS